MIDALLKKMVKLGDLTVKLPNGKTVRENLAFPLRNRGVKRDEIGRRVESDRFRFRCVTLHHAGQLLASAGFDEFGDAAAILIRASCHPLDAFAPAHTACDLLHQQAAQPRHGGRREGRTDRQPCLVQLARAGD